MANFTAGTSFTDGVTNDVTADKLRDLVQNAVPTSNLALNSTTGTIATFNSTTSTITNLSATTSTFLGTITGSTNVINIGSGQIYKDASGNVGVGTASPSGKLEILQNSTSNTTPAIKITGSSGDPTNYYMEVVPNLSGSLVNYRFNVKNISTYNDVLCLNGAGNVGIGTTSPTAQVTISKVVNSATLPSASANHSISLYPPTTTGYYGGGISWAEGANTAANICAVDDGASGALGIVLSTGNNSAITERLRIDSSGNVGIGTSSPARLLTVDNATNPEIGLYTGGTERVKLSTGGSAISQLVVDLGGAERLRIDSSGNLLVGTTDTSFSTGVGLKFRASATAPIMGYVMNTAGVETSYNLFNTNATNNGFRFYVNTNGGISNFSANNVNLSDERLKTNISLSGNYLDKICSIPVKTFNYKDQGEDTEKTIGVIAQEVEAHIPELINNDGFGETPADGIPLKTIYQTDLQYVLMRCIQEQQVIINELKTKVSALEAA